MKRVLVPWMPAHEWTVALESGDRLRGTAVPADGDGAGVRISSPGRVRADPQDRGAFLFRHRTLRCAPTPDAPYLEQGQDARRRTPDDRATILRVANPGLSA